MVPKKSPKNRQNGKKRESVSRCHVAQLGEAQSLEVFDFESAQPGRVDKACDIDIMYKYDSLRNKYSNIYFGRKQETMTIEINT